MKTILKQQIAATRPISSSPASNPEQIVSISVLPSASSSASASASPFSLSSSSCSDILAASLLQLAAGAAPTITNTTSTNITTSLRDAPSTDVTTSHRNTTVTESVAATADTINVPVEIEYKSAKRARHTINQTTKRTTNRLEETEQEKQNEGSNKNDQVEDESDSDHPLAEASHL